jgi:uncharacterized protein (DUF305 family)
MKALPTGLVLVLLSFPAFAQPHDMPGAQPHDMPGPEHPAEQDMTESMRKMDSDMAAVPMTGDADRDFAAMMIPHHQGAVDMAKTELQAGKDPALRHLATQIVISQKREIAMMRRWLAAHPAP